MYNRIYNIVYFFALITAEGNDALDPHNAMDQEPPVIAVTETATTDAVCLPMDLEPTVSDTTTCNEIPSDSVNPSPLSENNPSLPNGEQHPSLYLFLMKL